MSASSGDMSLTDWTMSNQQVPAGLNVWREFAYMGPHCENRIELLYNRKVRFDGGEAHGHWELEDDLDLYITFHYAADTSKMKNLHFKRISRTDDFYLFCCKDAEWFRVLCRRHPPVEAAD